MSHDPDELKRFFEGVVGTCEATRCEEHYLWKELHVEHKYEWKQGGSGYGECIGYVGNPKKGRSIFLSLMCNTINGHKILFYHVTSRFVDHEKVREWLEENMPKSAFRLDGYLNNADATNFVNVLHDADRRKAEKAAAP